MDIMNINNISPNVWGPPGWNFLHYISFTYPNNPTKEDKEKYLNFFKYVGDVLPCEKCRYNYKKHQEKKPLNDTVLSSKQNLVKWLIDIHNEVNIINGKKQLSYEEVVRHYFGSKKKFYRINKKYLIILLIFIIIIILCLVLKTYSKQFSDLF